MNETFGLIDCNHLFVSCDRLSRQDLEGKPIIVIAATVCAANTQSGYSRIVATDAWFPNTAPALNMAESLYEAPPH